MADALQQLAEAGVATWLDDLRRTRIHSGELACMMDRDGVVGITTNPTIFAKSWDELIASVTNPLETAGAEVTPGGAVKPTADGDRTNGSGPASAAPRQTAPG